MPDLAALNYAPLKARVSKAELDAFRSAREVLGYDEATGFDEQKAAVTSKDDTAHPGADQLSVSETAQVSPTDQPAAVIEAASESA